MIVYDSQYKQLKTGFRHSTENTVHICEAMVRPSYVTTWRRIAEIWEKKIIILSNIQYYCVLKRQDNE